MLKFISISNERDYEEGLLQELNFNKESYNIPEFLASIKPNEFLDNLKQHATRNEVNESKVLDFCRSRVFLLMSLLSSRRSANQLLNHSDTNSKAFSNTVELLNLITQDKFPRLTSLEEFYFVLPARSDYKADSLSYILNMFSKEDSKVFNALKDRIAGMMVDFIQNSESHESVCQILSQAGQVAEKLKNYGLFRLEANNTTGPCILICEKVRHLVNEGHPSLTKEIAKLHFFILFNNLTIHNFKHDLNKAKSVYDKYGLTSESKLVNSIISNNLNEIETSYGTFENVYGSSSSEIICKNAKLRVIYNILLTNTKGNILQFSELAKFNIKIDDLEDTMFDAQNLHLFKLIIDYEMSVVRVSYLRKFSYTKENLEKMRERTVALRGVLQKFAKKIDLLLISE